MNDTTFHAVVDMLRVAIMKYELTPSEIREAAMLACVMQEEINPSPVVIAVSPEVAAEIEMRRKGIW